MALAAAFAEASARWAAYCAPSRSGCRKRAWVCVGVRFGIQFWQQKVSTVVGRAAKRNRCTKYKPSYALAANKYCGCSLCAVVGVSSSSRGKRVRQQLIYPLRGLKMGMFMARIFSEDVRCTTYSEHGGCQRIFKLQWNKGGSKRPEKAIDKQE
eukprot:1142407-Pelagomonas_calceolata.AAC.6